MSIASAYASRGFRRWWWVAVVWLGVAAISSAWRIPVPLNEVGAPSAVSAMVALGYALVGTHILAHELPLLETRYRRAATTRAAALVMAFATPATAVLGGAVGSTHLVRVGLASIALTGLGLVTLRTSPVPPWLLPLAVVLASLVLGVERYSEQRHGWAWLLADTPQVQSVEWLVSGALGVAGAGLYALRRPRLTRDLE